MRPELGGRRPVVVNLILVAVDPVASDLVAPNDVPPSPLGQITLGRSRQPSLRGWPLGPTDHCRFPGQPLCDGPRGGA
jgi:hypothetical protein